ncbi:MAG: hypothetical protein J6X11_08735 [Treponema sp.]|nr:hypothetical protein [Treponema sp.]
MQDEFVHVKTADLLKKLPALAKGGMTEFSVDDIQLAGNKKFIESLCKTVQNQCPGMFISFPLQARIIDRPLVELLQETYCSIDIPLEGSVRQGQDSTALLFDKKLYSTKAALLNNAGIVFGFSAGYGIQQGDSFKAFRDRLDFALTLYPNHINFPQFADGANGTDGASGNASPKPTGTYSSKDLDFSRGISFACRTFYTCGRAVPWFNSVTKALKVYPTAFFSDFDEWQQCNNCSFITDYVPENAPHTEIEKMQLSFLSQKFEEKHKEHLFAAVKDLVQLNGAFSRVAQEGEESIIQTSYNPDDILSPYSQDIARFADSTAMEMCRVKVFAGADSPDYKIL